MQIHSSNCLEGPISAERAWWRDPHGYPALEVTATEPPVSDATEERPHMASEPADRPDGPQDPEETLFRAGLVEQIRREIAAGTYETPEKLEVALERMLRRLELD
jgi:hypothetical protein